MNNREMGKVIRLRRRFKRVGQDELAEMCGVSQSLICKIEQGKLEPGIRLAFTIGLILGIDWSHMMAYSSAGFFIVDKYKRIDPGFVEKYFSKEGRFFLQRYKKHIHENLRGVETERFYGMS